MAGHRVEGQTLGSVDLLADWDYIAEKEEGRGARLWRRVRRNIDKQARLQNISRLEYIIYVLITIAANEATGVRDAVAGVSAVSLS